MCDVVVNVVLQIMCLASGDEHVQYTFGERSTCTRSHSEHITFLAAEGRLQLSVNADVGTIAFFL